jgi:hypothetical protein
LRFCYALSRLFEPNDLDVGRCCPIEASGRILGGVKRIVSRARKPQRASSGYRLGVCLYPEQWSRERWAPYARQMRALGFTYVRLGDFTWSEAVTLHGTPLDSGSQTFGRAPIQLPDGWWCIWTAERTI